MRTSTPRRSRRGFRYEALETRTLFNTLLVDGTAGNDTITLGLTDKGQIRVVLNGNETDYKPGDFTDIVINGEAGQDTINVRATVLPTTVGSRGQATINIGNTDGVQDIKADVTQTGFPGGPAAVGTATLNIDDTGDTTARNVTIDGATVGGKISGLAPADIIFDDNPPAVSPAADPIVGPRFNSLHLTTGSGDDTVTLRFLPADFPLTLDSSGGNDTANVGDGNTAANIGSSIDVTNANGQTALTVDDSQDKTARTVTLSVGSNASGPTGIITGLTNPIVTPAPQLVAIGNVTFNAAQVSSVTIDGGSGGNTFDVNGTPTSKAGTPGGPPITLNTGAGGDTVNVNATAAGTQLNVNGKSGNDKIAVSILGTQGDVNITGGDSGSGGDTLTLNTPSPLTAIATPLVNLTTGKATHGSATINYAGVENLVLSGGGAFAVNGDLGALNLTVTDSLGGPLPLADPIPATPIISTRINTSQNLKSLTITNAGVQVTAGMDKVLNTNALTITNGLLDLTDNSMQVHYADTDPFKTIRSYIFNDSVRSSLADARHNLGYADSADGVVNGLADKTVLVKYTLNGDANLDGHVGFADLLLLAQHFGKQDNANWDQGDFNYDGKVNFADLLLLAQNFGRSI